jgi:hypothetical protein
MKDSLPGVKRFLGKVKALRRTFPAAFCLMKSKGGKEMNDLAQNPLPMHGRDMRRPIVPPRMSRGSRLSS